MRKFKIISTCAALVLMVALMAFGVYAAANSFTLSVSGTISFKCTDVYIKVTYGIVGDSTKTYGPYSSQPGATMAWKDADGNAVTFDTTKNEFANKLPDMVFTETADEATMPTCTYFVTVENLHGMPIGIKLGYKWTDNANTQNPITAVNKVVEGTDVNATAKYQINDAAAGVVFTPGQFDKESTLTLFVTLTLDNEDYVAGGALQMAISTAVNTTGVTDIQFS